jgi:chromosome segregation ATPase
MGYALRIYQAFKDLGEEKAAVLAEFVEYVESQKAATSEELKETELRLQGEIAGVRLEVEQVRKELKETELRLQKEIEGVRLEVEQVRKELKETELRLQGEIEQVRKELKETELRLQKEIAEVRLEVEQVRKEIHKTKSSLIKWMFFFWTGQLITLATLLKLMLH